MSEIKDYGFTLRACFKEASPWGMGMVDIPLDVVDIGHAERQVILEDKPRELEQLATRTDRAEARVRELEAENAKLKDTLTHCQPTGICDICQTKLHAENEKLRKALQVIIDADKQALDWFLPADLEEQARAALEKK